MNFKNTKTKILMWVPNVLKFLIRTRINIIGFDNIVGIDRVGIMWMGIDSGGKWSGGNWPGLDLIWVGFDSGGNCAGGIWFGWDLIRVGFYRVGFDSGRKWSGGIWFGLELIGWELCAGWNWTVPGKTPQHQKIAKNANRLKLTLV